ncbi:prephenate dehydratase [Desulforamulus hydrothermalis]|uniref:Prephenate dehydratase n=1 Tax=Desulforamulus hydrothermalis Lam5 = DSM 18033 TaxID=1121428 RepID=K8EB97_9FIRM|nr:prephenate dehydratase [Desulforamulus hydrothermalis]CCO08903.1 Prephenate dehydratase [Desulforamulus hydrothermalis Lam5 = DSM 18033]SHG74384.1 prephenate dehydratase [Desulforamulus hydrothermalis Lam5 = DSM 18033]
MNKIAYLGPRGTFSEQAAQAYAAAQPAQPVPCATLQDVCQGVAEGRYAQGVLPFENLLEGTVNPVLDLLLELPGLKIQAELLLPVAHHLLVRPGSNFRDIRAVLSHPQALAQCRRFLADNLPAAQLIPVESTARAAGQVAGGDNTLAAVATDAAAQYYNLTVLAPNIQDRSDNCTRFVVVGRQEIPCRGPSCKTSLAVSLPDRPGSLYSILKEFAWRGINLTRIESRPARTSLGEYIFLIELAGHRADPDVSEALANLADQARQIRLLGCYPACRQEPGASRQPAATLAELRQAIDIIDGQIIALLGQRARLVTEVGKRKPAGGAVRDQAREAQVLARVRRLARHHGFAEPMAETIYRTLLDHFVELQTERQTAGLPNPH